MQRAAGADRHGFNFTRVLASSSAGSRLVLHDDAAGGHDFVGRENSFPVDNQRQGNAL